MKKLKFLIIPLVMSLVVLAGCAPKGEENVKTEANKTVEETKKPEEAKKPEEVKKPVEEKVDAEVLNRFDKYFYKGEDELIYIGMAEYGFMAKYDKEDVKDAKEKVVVYEGAMRDGMGEPEGKGPREFTVSYTVDKDKIVEKIDNRDYVKNKKTILNSIIENFVVVKGEVKVGNKWEQGFKIEDKEYKAVTEIKSLDKKGDKDEFVVESTVKDIKGYKDNTYVERRTYREGLGLIMLEYRPTMVNGQEPMDDFIGYSLNYLKDKDGNVNVIER
ncbi:hypothetical protein LGK99_10770 [Clostridium algidicarnis]|uniref:hypothetical protein n=1 Tax=Clostridium algidicarnis TaxID=37659 RepID=UPI001CF416B1|nr:hypothetical protein [Clostridium algidicarnis]MCB2287559.1 hypothetical protein [Clostridium algidicarnis]